MGLMATIADRRIDFLTPDHAAGGRRNCCALVARGAGLRSLPSSRLSRARPRRRSLPDTGTDEGGMAEASLRGAQMGSRDRADVVEPGEIRLSGMVLSPGLREAVPDI